MGIFDYLKKKKEDEEEPVEEYIEDMPLHEQEQWQEVALKELCNNKSFDEVAQMLKDNNIHRAYANLIMINSAIEYCRYLNEIKRKKRGKRNWLAFLFGNKKVK